ncbi:MULTISPECIES: immunity 26/phosphotriesterase HocA family protein [Bacillaceae]|uniref:Immunity 26/phosphotriesterase HocA family protein n=1 Tax=Evansella alkalicola TaxID=745819 RepID=A0ABS6K080_9BACI|nr:MULTISPECIES: immunity 26/phosphotriesterase HocA family protein [Bacillaceae]MBU9723344.1 immunity 26/phosphotriesterase HocA family protein [Bacillus alkalicola]
MKKYKRLKMLRTFGPFIVVIPMIILQNFIMIIILALAWILIDILFIEPKLPSKKKRQEGEIFIIEPTKNTYFYGKVIRKQIPINDPTMHGGHLVYIYQQTNNPLDIPELLHPNNLIIPPQIIDNKGWEKGYFQSVGIQEITNEELELNYGFWDIVTQKYVNEEGKELDQTPDIYADYGLVSHGSIEDELKMVLVSSEVS